MTDPAAELPDLPELPPDVLDRMVAELGRPSEKIVACLATAANLLSQARATGERLRLAESAAYNLREALDAVVEDQSAAKGGLDAVLEAWRRYQTAVRAPSADVVAARSDLDSVLERVEADKERQAYKTRKLLEYIRNQTGVEPRTGTDDPLAKYGELRRRGNNVLHGSGTVTRVAALYDDTIAWFIRFFTPPDDRVRHLTNLARLPYSEDALGELRGLALNAHHLGLFFSQLQDPNWLAPLFEQDLIQLPKVDEPWPVERLVDGLGTVDATRVATALGWLLKDSESKPDVERLRTARAVMQTAERLGEAGHELVVAILRSHRTDRWVQMIAVSVAEDSDASDPLQLAVADAIVGSEHAREGGAYSHKLLTQLVAGLTPSNVTERITIVAAKTRRLARAERMRFVMIDIAPLTTDGEDLRDPVLILAFHLALMIARARGLGVSSAELLQQVESIPGELGQRLVCRVLAGADDVARSTKVDHVAHRILSETATGDDRDLVDDLLTTPLLPAELELWQNALGEPSRAPEQDADAGAFGENWARAWRWSMVLPAEALVGWGDALAAVTARHGAPTPASLDTRIPRFISSPGRSPYSSEELAALSALDAARLVASWRPTADEWNINAGQLASALEATVKEHPADWTREPSAIVAALREPLYVARYFRALAEEASVVQNRAAALIAATELARAEEWIPESIGSEGQDHDWASVHVVSVDLIAALANAEGPLGDDLPTCWARVNELATRVPSELSDGRYNGDLASIDAFSRAVNEPYGRGLEAVLALGGWEHRNLGAASGNFFGALDSALATTGHAAVELRAILAARRLFLEGVAAQWLDERANELFDDSTVGAITFGQTLMWSRPTDWFYDRYKEKLISAARKGAEHAASRLLLAFLWDRPGYTFEVIVGAFKGNVDVLRTLAEEIASLLQAVERGDLLDRGLQFWADLLDADRENVPAAALTGLGRWTFVDAVDEKRWFDLMDRTLDLTNGETDMAIEIADRCLATPTDRSLRMLRRMIGHGDPWERDYVERAAVDALRAPAEKAFGDEFELLRTRLIERGRHEAVDIVRNDPDSRSDES